MKRLKKEKRLLAVTVYVFLLICITGARVFSAGDYLTEECAARYELIPEASGGCCINGYYYPPYTYGTPNSSFTLNTGNYVKVFYYGNNGAANMVVHYTDHGNPAHHANPHYHLYNGVYNNDMHATVWQENSHSDTYYGG